MPVNTAQVDPQGPETGVEHALRGGCCHGLVWSWRSAYRGRIRSDLRYRITGFRIVLELTEEEFLRYAHMQQRSAFS
jgi:formylglycine-generating enzyme required for sulfatase activity